MKELKIIISGNNDELEISINHKGFTPIQLLGLAEVIKDSIKKDLKTQAQNETK